MKTYKTLEEVLGTKTEPKQEETGEKSLDNEIFLDWDGSGEEVSSEEAERRFATMERYLNGIRDAVLGRKYCFLPDVEDTGARLSEEKVRTFIREMLECHPDYATMSADDRRFFECFLYCAVVGPSAVQSGFEVTCYESRAAITRTFKELIRLADDKLFHADSACSYAAQEECERTFPETSTGFTFYMNEAYRLLTGQSEWHIYSPKELAEVMETYAELRGEDPDSVTENAESYLAEADREVVGGQDVAEVESEEAEAESVLGAIEPEAEPETGDEIVLSPPPPEFYRGIEMQRESLRAECEWSWNRWMEHLPEGHCLTETYLELRRRAFARDNASLREEVTRMVDAYADRHRLSMMYQTGKFKLMEQTVSISHSTVHRLL